MNWIHTRTGVRFSLAEPTPEMVNILDIAHALAAISRYCGHTYKPYSVAQHSVLVSRYVPEQHAMWGLLHDAAEAYVTDVSRPLKQAMRDISQGRVISPYDIIESRVMEAVCKKFGLTMPEPPAVKDADNAAVCTERMDLFGDAHTQDWHHVPANGFHPFPNEIIHPVDWRTAKEEFLERFFELGGKL